MFEQRGWERIGQLAGPVPDGPSFSDPTQFLAWAARAPLTGAWLDNICAVDPDNLPGADRIALIVGLEQQRRALDAAFTTALGSIAMRPCRPEPGDPSCEGGSDCWHDWSREDIAAALHIGPRHAGALLDEARELVSRLPDMLELVAQGSTSLTHARRLAARTLQIADAGKVRAVQDQVLAAAQTDVSTAFDRKVVAAIDRLTSPEETRAAHREAKTRQSGITPTAPMADGMGGALLIGTAEQIAALFGWARGFTVGNRDKTDHCTVGERRIGALLRALSDGAGDGVAGQPTVALKLIMNARTLAGQDNEPGWLQGYGDLAAALARELAMTPASLQALFIHSDTGLLMDLSPELRTPGARLDRYVRARDAICTAPGCAAAADHLDLDHITPVSHGGKTIRRNLHPLCPRHHRSRHAGGWAIDRKTDGSEIWTDPHGFSYRTRPTDYRALGDTGPPGHHPPPADYDPLELVAESRPSESDEPPGDNPCPF